MRHALCLRIDTLPTPQKEVIERKEEDVGIGFGINPRPKSHPIYSKGAPKLVWLARHINNNLEILSRF